MRPTQEELKIKEREKSQVKGGVIIKNTATVMPRYYCDYCGTYLTHDSAPGRRQHNRGEKDE